MDQEQDPGVEYNGLGIGTKSRVEWSRKRTTEQAIRNRNREQGYFEFKEIGSRRKIKKIGSRRKVKCRNKEKNRIKNGGYLGKKLEIKDYPNTESLNNYSEMIFH